jgi:beta-lactamase class A
MDRRFFLAGATALLAAPALAQSDLKSQIEALERRSGGRLGVAVLDTGSGRRFAWRGDERFPLCSTFKFLLAAAILEAAEAGRERLRRHVAIAQTDILSNSPFSKSRVGRGASVAELCRAMIIDSDNAAANLLLPSIGGGTGFTRFARELGDAVTRLDRNEPTLGEAASGDPRDTTAPAAMVGDLESLLLGSRLRQRSRETLTGWMLACRTGPGRLRAGLPAGWRIGHKTGTGMNGTANDIAILWPKGGARPLLVAAYLTGSRLSPALTDSVLASVGRAVSTRFSPGGGAPLRS